jgi:hypothetical protein
MAEQQYRRLTPPRRRRFFSIGSAKRSSLWLGKDHLLSMDSTRFSEEYKRFYFRDIQAITIRKTKRRAIWNGALIILLTAWTGVFLGILLPRPDGFEPVVITLLRAWFLILAIPLVANNVLGPASTVYLRTAVQIEELPSLNRVRRARKVLDRIRPLIAAAQGQLTPEEVSIRMREMVQASEPSVAAAAAAAGNTVVTSPLHLSLADDPGGPPQIGAEPR